MSKVIDNNKLSALSKATHKACAYIESCQLPSGAIPWFKTGKLDPWDHTEAAIALSICGNLEASFSALNWLSENQNADGSWFANYFLSDSGAQMDNRIETNFVAYPATGLWFHYLCSKDKETLKYFYPMIEKAMGFVLAQQSTEGEIQWALPISSNIAKDALVTACSSILRSLECAINIADSLNISSTKWRTSYLALYEALKNKPWRFDRTWESKQRYSMDWFYPILAGIYNPDEARLRIQERWPIFVEPNIGCRCVSEEPWMTVAESCELCVALLAANRRKEAASILLSLLHWQDDDGGFWTGYNFRDQNIWPREKTSWTAAAFILAVDALTQKSPGATLFTEQSQIY